VIEPFDGNCGYMSATKLCSVGIVYLALTSMLMNLNLDEKSNQYFRPSFCDHRTHILSHIECGILHNNVASSLHYILGFPKTKEISQ
jgi:hypothetical protein